ICLLSFSATYLVLLVFFHCCGDPRHLYSFPTRRSSDLPRWLVSLVQRRASTRLFLGKCQMPPSHKSGPTPRLPHRSQRTNLRSKDRKSTRLNSSHVKISYAVFCLKKKKKK